MSNEIDNYMNLCPVKTCDDINSIFSIFSIFSILYIVENMENPENLEWVEYQLVSRLASNHNIFAPWREDWHGQGL